MANGYISVTKHLRSSFTFCDVNLKKPIGACLYEPAKRDGSVSVMKVLIDRVVSTQIPNLEKAQ